METIIGTIKDRKGIQDNRDRFIFSWEWNCDADDENRADNGGSEGDFTFTPSKEFRESWAILMGMFALLPVLPRYIKRNTSGKSI
jgi:hypothetical protein